MIKKSKYILFELDSFIEILYLFSIKYSNKTRYEVTQTVIWNALFISIYTDHYRKHYSIHIICVFDCVVFVLEVEHFSSLLLRLSAS